MQAKDIVRNTVKEKLARNEVVASMTVRLVRSIEIAQIAKTAGFDMIYACQDFEFDVRQGLYSVPARWGIARALSIASACHFALIALTEMSSVERVRRFTKWLLIATAIAVATSTVKPMLSASSRSFRLCGASARVRPSASESRKPQP